LRLSIGSGTAGAVAKPKISSELMKVLQELGRVGGQTRAKNLSEERRHEIARKAAAVRWKKTKKG